MQLDHNVAGACKLVPAVWPWSMPLRTGDRVQLCGLIIYSYNTATLETSGTHCIYLHSCVVALMLGFVCDSENNADLSAHHLSPLRLQRENARSVRINHFSAPNHEQRDRYKLTIPSPTITLSIDRPKGPGVKLFPSFRGNHLAHILVSDAFLRFSTQFSRNNIFWEHSTIQYFRELYFTGIFDLGKCDFESGASGGRGQQIKFIAMRKPDLQEKDVGAEMSVKSSLTRC